MKLCRIMFLVVWLGLLGCSRNETAAEELSMKVERAHMNEMPPENLQASLEVRREYVREKSRENLILPNAYQFKKSLQIRTHNTWNETIDSMPKNDAAHLSSINANYFGSLAFDDADELQDMAAKGFPLPEEWIEASYMTDQELKALSDSGNLKAKVFYLDRLLTRANEYFDLRGVDDSAYQRSPGAKYSLLAYELAAQIQSSYKSPFSGYLLGAAYSRLNYPQSPESAAAGMFVALSAGDKRALGLFRRYEVMHPNMNAGEIMSAYSALR